MSSRRIVYICDWLPPNYGAVGQYSMLYARELAAEGHHVVLAGLTSGTGALSEERLGAGILTTIRLEAPSYEKHRLVQRMIWTARINSRMMARLLPRLRTADEIVFTGSPPLLLHWIAPLNLFLRKRLVYRISDFHPECLMAGMKRPSLMIRMLYRLTLFWRRRVDAFEILGEDQRARLAAIGIPAERILLKRDPSPVEIAPDTQPLSRPEGSEDRLLLLYSGNWGVAHDADTFIEAYRRHHREGTGRFVLWLNAVGAKADYVASAIRAEGLPLVRGKPVPLDELASLLVTPDAHLITLRDAFVGFVLPSKVYGCIASGKPILYVGSTKSDVHLLCSEAEALTYERMEVGEVDACLAALERLADTIAENRLSKLRVLAAQAQEPAPLQRARA